MTLSGVYRRLDTASVGAQVASEGHGNKKRSDSHQNGRGKKGSQKAAEPRGSKFTYDAVPNDDNEVETTWSGNSQDTSYPVPESAFVLREVDSGAVNGKTRSPGLLPKLASSFGQVISCTPPSGSLHTRFSVVSPQQACPDTRSREGPICMSSTGQNHIFALTLRLDTEILHSIGV